MKKHPALLSFILAVALLVTGPALAERPFSLGGEITVTKVSDGDSLRSGRLKIRLFGIDAPELKQDCIDTAGRDWPCGKAARARLAELVDGPLQCELIDVDRYGRLVMRCRTGETDIAEALVAQGLALAYRRYATDYVAAEEAARAARAGVWGGEFTAPWDWRRAN